MLRSISSALALCHHGLKYAKTPGDEAEFCGFEKNWERVIHRDIKPGNSKFQMIF